MAICKICNKEVDLRTHIKTHKISAKDYYDKYLKKQDEGICPACGKQSNFISVGQGYHLYCSNKCQCSCKEIQEKRVKTWRLNGCGNKKRKETWSNKTDKEIEEMKSKIKKTIKENHGVEFYSQSKEWKKEAPSKISKTLSTKIENGEFLPFGFDVNDIKKYCEENEIEYKGYTNIFQIPEIIKKCEQTRLKKYGDKHYANREKMKETMKERYGVEHCMQNHDIFKKTRKRYEFNGLNFDSKPELAYYILLKDNSIEFEYQPDIDFIFEYDGLRHYKPDFKVGNEIIEIKGLHFFENNNPNGKMFCPYHKKEDTDEDIKWRNGLFEAKHQCMIKNGVKIITDYSEYLNYVNEKYTSDFLDLFRKDISFPYLNVDLKNKGDLGIIHHFHKSIYEAHRKNKPSPIEAWKNKDLVYKCALNRLKYMGRCKPSDILQGFNVTKLAPKISVFKPELATKMIKKYLNNYGAIIDPFSGFSGRLLGSYNCNKEYIGYDINEKHIQESKEIIDYKQIKNSKVYIEDLITAPIRTYENSALFTCPPYGGKEHWNKDNDEIEKSCDEWIDLCLEKHKCSKYLFVVDKTEKYKDYIVETLTNTSHFGSNNEYVILIGNL